MNAEGAQVKRARRTLGTNPGTTSGADGPAQVSMLATSQSPSTRSMVTVTQFL